jgi:2-polyprenyl-3-methyl-5-hydroxy-6-metoxy-1,4-benzoquinol methylase
MRWPLPGQAEKERRGLVMNESTFTAESLRELAYGFRKSRVLLTAYELDLFTYLGKEWKAAAEIARLIKADPRATDRLMNALVAMGILSKSEGRFANTTTSLRFLVRTSPDYMSGLMHTAHLWHTWSTLTEAVEKGTSAIVSRQLGGRGHGWLEAFIAAMHYRALQQAPAVAAAMNLDGVKTILDVGGGSGAFATAFVRAAKNVRATVFDLPDVIVLTRKYIGGEGLEGRISTVSGDYLTDELPMGYDLIFLSAIVHSNSPDENRVLMRKCAGALNSGGRVVVQDFVMSDDRIEPATGAFFALNMLVGTKAGDTFTESEIRSWMEEAGLVDVIKKDMLGGTAQIIGRKRT